MKLRRKSAVNIWRKFHRERIDKLAKLHAARENIGKSGMASLRDKIARDLFYDLPEEEQKEWTCTADEEHKEAMEEWNNARNRAISTAPADRQRAIQNLVRFVQPVLDVIANSTGWKVSLFAGGPEPAQEGMLNVISVHSGTTTGDIKLSFGQSERASIKKDFIPSFGAFLQKCYSPEECHARALSELEGFVPISDMELEGGDALIHPLEPVSVTPSSQPTTVVSALTANSPAPPPTVQPAPVVSINTAQPALIAPANATQPNRAEDGTEDDESMPALQDPMADDEDDEEEDDEEDTPLPTVYRFLSEPPASPGISPASVPPSRQGSIAPSAPASPNFGPPSLPSLPSPAESSVPALSLTSPPLAPSPSVTSSASPSVTSPPAPPATSVPASSVSPASTACTNPSSTPSSVPSATLALSTPSSKANKKRKRNKENATPVVHEPSPLSTPPSNANKKRKRNKENATPVVHELSGTTDDRRPRREVKKTAKALRIEEEIAEKSERGKQRSQKDVGEPSSAVLPASKRSRGASTKRGSRV